MYKLKDLLNKLPDNYIKQTKSNLGKLISIFLDQINDVNDVKENIKKQKKLEEATGYSLNQHGANVQQARGNLKDDIYRLLIKSKIRTNLSPGDINSLIEYIATMLQIEKTKVTINEPAWGSFRFSSKKRESEYSENEGFDYGTLKKYNYEPAFFEFSVPSEAVNNLLFPVQNLVDVIDKMAGAGIRVGFYIQGTFEFSSKESESEYSEETGFDYGKFGSYYNPSDGLDLPE